MMNEYDEDKVCLLLNSLVQHGSKNSRVYLMKAESTDYPRITDEIDKLAEEKGYTKSFAKIPKRYKDAFLSSGYVCEGIIPRMYGGEEDGYFLSKYYDLKRGALETGIITDEILRSRCNGDFSNQSEEKNQNGFFHKGKRFLEKGFSLRQALPCDSAALSRLFKKTFESYPFPLSNPSYIKRTMDENILYFGIWKNDNLLAAASSETDLSSKSVEMTDFATDKDFLGRGFAGLLLDAMEKEMKDRGFITSYTIARATFLPVNLLFYKRGYKFSGTLAKNTNICGSFESMNIWYKKLSG